MCVCGGGGGGGGHHDESKGLIRLPKGLSLFWVVRLLNFSFECLRFFNGPETPKNKMHQTYQEPRSK